MGQTIAKHSIVLADDHAIVRKGVKSLLELIEGVEVVAEADNGLRAISLVKKHCPSVTVMDIAMPHANGVEAIEEIRRWSNATKIVILTGLTSRGLLKQIDDLAVHGLFLKSDEPEELAQAIPRILAGERVRSAGAMVILRDPVSLSSLTPRELQVLYGVSRGQNNVAIAQKLGVSVNTVDKHRTALMRKLNVHSAAELIACAMREGLLDAAGGL